METALEKLDKEIAQNATFLCGYGTSPARSQILRFMGREMEREDK